jgi:heme-degrading monooxygenase HmoA
MAVGFINHLGEGGEAFYEAVHRELGLDMRAGTGQWPEGLISHTAAMSDDGFIVVELWESKEAQAHFRDTRLMPAIQGVEVKVAPKIAWFEVVAHQEAASRP